MDGAEFLRDLIGGFLKINAGCGYVYLPGYVNVDIKRDSLADRIMPAERMDFPPGSADEVRAFQFIEHLGYFRAMFFLRECRRVLADGGKLSLETPSPEDCFRAFLRGDSREKETALGWIYGSESDKMGHVFCFPEELLVSMLERCGFEIKRKEKRGLNGFRPSLAVDAFKSADANKDDMAVFSRRLVESGIADFRDEFLSFENEKALEKMEVFLAARDFESALEYAVFNPRVSAAFLRFFGRGGLAETAEHAAEYGIASRMYAVFAQHRRRGLSFSDSWDRTVEAGKKFLRNGKPEDAGKTGIRNPLFPNFFSRKMIEEISGRAFYMAARERCLGGSKAGEFEEISLLFSEGR